MDGVGVFFRIGRCDGGNYFCFCFTFFVFLFYLFYPVLFYLFFIFVIVFEGLLMAFFSYFIFYFLV